MALIKHCIVDTTTDKVVNIIDYETEQTGVPPGFEEEAAHLLCVPIDNGQIGGTYENGVITNPEPLPIITEELASVLQTQETAKASALAKLTALGLSEDEVKALVG